jgi:hypothetical protein
LILLFWSRPLRSALGALELPLRRDRGTSRSTSTDLPPASSVSVVSRKVEWLRRSVARTTNRDWVANKPAYTA